MVPVHLIPVRRRTVGCDFSHHKEFRRLARRCRYLVGGPLLMPAADIDSTPAHTLRDIRQKGHEALLVVLFQAFQKAKPQLLPCLFRGQRLIGCLRQRINKTFEPFAERLFRRLLSCLRRQRQTLDGLTVRNRFNICIYSFFIEKSSISPKALPVISPAGHTISCKFFVFPLLRSIFFSSVAQKRCFKSKEGKSPCLPHFSSHVRCASKLLKHASDFLHSKNRKKPILSDFYGFLKIIKRT